ncbi:hypothetical protein CMI44_00280 [Candidatus Pacearchaeota archaeon]|mgnify:CR=1 FL=1|jgi:predicted TIM-barrel fold metal-dependent hydrolase|nr:hypothetical protein [Candidatus Pacearchaeota archaeon]
MSKEKNRLKILKEDYSKLKEKYSLPSFEELNKDFQIERAVEVQTDYLIRELRRLMAEKFSNYLRSIESIINPVNVPMFVFSIVKAMTSEDKKRLTTAYKKLVEIEISLVKVDVDFSEDNEAEFIKESYSAWQEIKKDVSNFVESVQKNWNNKIGSSDKGYFG